ncbi:MAG: phosphatidate cytidylyltransferase [Flavobacteriales bacterium]|nr:phosphatidate cytidylyltransferase [Flavobacteriales bacterium]NCG30275.1 hypothetical protein [Bacteroidota bacterium]MBT3963846.1 phosphatidate cytidylyltransferase [Flavobacteriales bacterium]MBT4704946.1 phosphatidate cytidylyltransferase [Flavobacteriales bacterium]MBT4929721.1 phosphatidate cytidylyltransferase [Flavobacteriales bacterium]
MSNLQLRVLSSIAFVVLIIGPLFIGPRWAFTIYAILGWFTLREFNNLLVNSESKINSVGSSIIYFLLVVIVYEYSFQEVKYASSLTLLLGATSLIMVIWEVFRKNTRPLSSIGISIFTPLYTASSFLGIAYFLGYRTDLIQPWIIISLFSLIWINDSAAYLFGRKIGKTKLIEHISPNKTWEGSISGLVVALLTGFGLSLIEGMPPWPIMLGFAVVTVIGGSLGDLFESRIKRAANVKDSGKFLPGHGGFLDRFDAMMLAIPIAILYFEFILPKS